MATRTRNDGVEFEKFCAQTLQYFGWTVAYTDTSNDQGLDLIAKKSTPPSHEFTIGCQCKDYTGSNVSNSEIRDFVGALIQAKIKVGYFFSSSDFTENARLAAREANESNQVIIKLYNKEKLKEFRSEAVSFREELNKEISKLKTEFEQRISRLVDQHRSVAHHMTGQIEAITRELTSFRSSSALELKQSEASIANHDRSIKLVWRLALVAITMSCLSITLVGLSARSKTSLSPNDAFLGRHESISGEKPSTQNVSDSSEVKKIGTGSRSPSKAPRSRDLFHSILPSLVTAQLDGQLCRYKSKVTQVRRYLDTHAVPTDSRSARKWEGILRSIEQCAFDST